MPKSKYLLVKYNNIHGEQEYSGHTVLTLNPRKKEETAIHDYFKNFWGLTEYGHYATDKEDCVKCESYMYFGGELAVDSIRWEEITEAQYNVLKELHLD